MSQIQSILDQITALSLEDQRKLNSMLVENIKSGIRRANVVASMSFSKGDIVEFDAGHRGIIRIKVDGFSRDHTKLKGQQLSVNGRASSEFAPSWNVGANICKKV